MQPMIELLETIPECLIWVHPATDTVAFCNRRCAALLHMSVDALLATPVSRLFSTSLPQLIAFTQEAQCVGTAMSDELTTHRDGKEIALEVTACVAEHHGHNLLCLNLRDKQRFQRWRIKNGAHKNHSFGLFHWSRIHEVFQQIEKENQLILSAAGEGIYGVDADGNTTFLNPAAERMLGYKAEELSGRNIHTAIHHSHNDGSDYCVQQCPIYAAFKDGEVHKVDHEVFWSKNGTPLAVEYTSTPIVDNGHLVGAVVVFRDVSDRREAETKLQQALAEVEQLKRRLELENAYLQEELSAGYNSYQIIGNSPAINQVLHQIQLVAPTVATVLITGESGTGKELIARAIHTASERHSRTLVRVNCAAIPADLFESEFFGHVRGAFSGAIQERQGRFQLADGGTLFLDEVGEIPLPLQGKLLRALQDNEFERVGESITHKVDVRVIAATNRDLKQLVEEGKFREDLYFRLNVFPIHAVALRHRRHDIALLAVHFLKKICQRFNKPELTVTLAQMQRLQQYDWPGNIRELENLIERQVILSGGDRLRLDDLPVNAHSRVESKQITAVHASPTLTESEHGLLRRRAIEQALLQSGGKLYGERGAAMILGLKPTTLASRLKKLGIDRRQYCQP